MEIGLKDKRVGSGWGRWQSRVMKLGWMGVIFGLSLRASLRAEDSVATVWDEFNKNGVVMVEPSAGLETPAAKGARLEREKEEAKAARLNRSLVEQGIYWLGGKWIKKGETMEAPKSAQEVKDTDRDGFDDFTEVKFQTDPHNPDSNPSHYFEAKGRNRVIFYATNPAAHGK